MAARTRYAPDRGLTVRMTATMFLLGLVFVAFIAAIIGIGTAYGASSTAIVFFAVILGGGFAIGSLFYSDKIALATAGAHEVSPTDSPEAARLHGIVDRLCALADMPKPRVAIADTDMPNAFATGRNADHAVVCATRGIMRRLENDELEGVLAHEMSHVAHKDVQVMTIASFLAIIAALLVRIAFYGELFGGGRRSNDSNAVAVMLRAHGGEHRRLRGQLPADQAAVPVPRAVRGPQRRAAHRAAERAEVRAGQGDRGHGQDPDQGPAHLAAAERVLLHAGRAPEPLSSSKLANIFSTHPSLERRLAELDKVQQQLGRTAG